VKLGPVPVLRKNPSMHPNLIDTIMKPSRRPRLNVKKGKKTIKTSSVIPTSAKSKEEIEGPRC